MNRKFILLLSFILVSKVSIAENIDTLIKSADKYYNGINTQKNYKKAYDYYKKASELGSGYASYQLANMCFLGRCKEKSKQANIMYYKKASEQGYIDATYYLGSVIYSSFKPVISKEEDLKLANKYCQYALNKYKEISKKNDGHALFKLGSIYGYGCGNIKIDFKKSEEYLLQASQNGSTEAMISLAKSYASGYTLAKDLNKAESLYKQAIKLGDNSAYLDLARFYERQKRYKDAEKTFIELSNKDILENVLAQDALGNYYYFGKPGILLDYKKAYNYYLKAAKEGFDMAQYHLAILYERGHGVSQNYVESYAWYSLSILQGNKGNSVTYRDNITRLMTTDELDISQKLTKEYAAKYIIEKY
jgi:TPR repeat protein